jgi:Zinc finger, C2H2 type
MGSEGRDPGIRADEGRWTRREADVQEGTGGGMTCSKCGQSFETQEELDRHMQEVHPDEGMGGGTEGATE